jgi:hypothetical protein
MDAGDVVVGGEEDQRRRDSGTATFLYERAAKARAAVIAGAGAKLAPR